MEKGRCFLADLIPRGELAFTGIRSHHTLKSILRVCYDKKHIGTTEKRRLLR